MKLALNTANLLRKLNPRYVTTGWKGGKVNPLPPKDIPPVVTPNPDKAGEGAADQDA